MRTSAKASSGVLPKGRPADSATFPRVNQRCFVAVDQARGRPFRRSDHREIAFDLRNGRLRDYED
jgi:hypothetical protein